jgi:hypothetical protein
LSRYHSGAEKDWNHPTYLATRKKVGKEHATHWSHDQKIVSDVWFTACSLSRLDVFQGICGGDREAAKLMLPWYMGSKHQDDLPDVGELSDGLVFLLEATVLLFTGTSLAVSVMISIVQANSFGFVDTQVMLRYMPSPEHNH